ncbi:NAD-dependent epimerase/dehydratase family protein [Agromyces sp. NPDC057865]|uniref:NAD-dependent epimerase/dehydratase family protein n=1 Tax=Agromyces sp. NPDC057865 TaxID=3346267 RepID=UPI003670E8CA
MRRVLLTGATGNWGRATLRELRERGDRIHVIALVMPTDRDREAIAEFADMENLEVVWGDLTDAATVIACVQRVDIVLHVGAVVSPLADEQPELAHRVNVGSMRNLIEAVRALPAPASVAVVGIGSVAQTGSRNPPHHWGRVGDPVRVSRFDEYGQSKVTAERLLVDSGLPKWVQRRQTGILHPGMLEIRDPIMTHSPFGAVMEWVSAEDSARLLANLCEPDVPDTVWGGIYNIGGGDGWRLTNWELQTAIGHAMGVRDIRRWYDRNWFATGNFHGQWYTDSDRLEQVVPFRQDSFEAVLDRAMAAAPSCSIGRASARLDREAPDHEATHPTAPRNDARHPNRQHPGDFSAFRLTRAVASDRDVVDVPSTLPVEASHTPGSRLRRVEAPSRMGPPRLPRSGDLPRRPPAEHRSGPR